MPSYYGDCIPDLSISTPVEGDSYIPEINDAIREIKSALKNEISIITKSSSHTLQPADGIVLVSGNSTMTLPATSGLSGKWFLVIKTDASNYTTTIATSAGAKINDAASPITLKRKWQASMLYTNGTDWYRIDFEPAERQQLQAPICQAVNLLVYVDPLYLGKVTATANEAITYNSNGFSKRLSSINLTADITGTGAGGLDTGSEAASTWYYIWLIAKEDDTKNLLLSTSSTSPTMPTDYLYKMFLGAVRNNASSDFVVFQQVEKRWGTDTLVAVVSGGTSTTYSNVDMTSGANAAACPERTKAVSIKAIITNNTGSATTVGVFVAMESTNGSGEMNLDLHCANGTAWKNMVYLPLHQDRKFCYKVTANTSATLSINGGSF